MPNQKKTVTESYKKSAAAVSKGRGTKQSRRTSAQNAALFGILTALALVLGYVESLVPVYLGAPGVKLGLANLVTMVGLYCMGTKETALIRHPVRAAFGHPVWPRRNCPEPYRHGSVQTVQAVRDGGSQHTGRSGP